ncbi:MAG: hypothetical protein ACRCXT_13110 [Paraclostridium sp.]
MVLMFGDHTTIPYDMKDLIIYNFNSFKECGYYKLNLIPNGIQMLSDDENAEMQFDMFYAGYILNNDAIFMDMMKIIYPIYNGMNIYIMIDSYNTQYNFIIESLQKFIQSRYGLQIYNINDLDDLEYISDSNFNIYGVYNLDQDKDRMTYLEIQSNPSILTGLRVMDGV